MVGQDGLRAEHLRDAGQEDVGRGADTDQLRPGLKDLRQEAADPAAAGAGQLPGVVDEGIHLAVEGLFCQRVALGRQKDADKVFVEPLGDEIVGLRGEILHGLRLGAADKEGGCAGRSLSAVGVEIAAQVHEVRGRQPASQDDPG